jgi:hypothetical protein
VAFSKFYGIERAAHLALGDHRFGIRSGLRPTAAGSPGSEAAMRPEGGHMSANILALDGGSRKSYRRQFSSERMK